MRGEHAPDGRLRHPHHAAHRSRGARACDASGPSRPVRSKTRRIACLLGRAVIACTGLPARPRGPPASRPRGARASATPAPRRARGTRRRGDAPSRRRRSPVDELKQPVLGGRVDAPRDPATQSQRPFPSASINRTPISFSASDEPRDLRPAPRPAPDRRRRPAAPRAATPPAPPARPACATVRSFITVERSTPARSAASLIVLLATHQARARSHTSRSATETACARRPAGAGAVGLARSSSTRSWTEPEQAARCGLIKPRDVWRRSPES